MSDGENDHGMAKVVDETEEATRNMDVFVMGDRTRVAPGERSRKEIDKLSIVVLNEDILSETIMQAIVMQNTLYVNFPMKVGKTRVLPCDHLFHC